MGLGLGVSKPFVPPTFLSALSNSTMEKQAKEVKQQAPAATMGDRERGYMASKAALHNLDKTLVPDNSSTATQSDGDVITPSQLGQQASAFKDKRDASRAATSAP